MPRIEQDSNYWSLPYKGIIKAHEELASHKVEVSFHFFDRFKETSVLHAARKMLKNNLDGLLAAPVLPKSFGQVLQELPEDLPVVFFDSYLPGIKPLSFIGQDAFQSGLLASCLMRQTVRRPKGKIAVIKILPEDYHIAERIQGFLQGSIDWPGFEVLVIDIDGNWPLGKTETELEAFYRHHQDLAGLFVTNAMTHKVAEWWKKKSVQDKVILIGYDPIPKNVRLLKEKVIDFLISQQSERQGYEGIYSLFRKVVLGEKVREKVMMQIDIITAENVDYYIS